MDEFDFYQGSHTGGEIDRDLDFVDGAFDANITVSGITVEGYIPAVIGGSATVYYVSGSEFQPVGESLLPALVTRGRAASAYRANNKLARSKCVKVFLQSVSSLPITVSQLPTYAVLTTDDMEVIRCVLSNPAAQTGDWTVTTSGIGVTISGTISGTTDITLYLAEPDAPIWQ